MSVSPWYEYECPAGHYVGAHEPQEECPVAVCGSRELRPTNREAKEAAEREVL